MPAPRLPRLRDSDRLLISAATATVSSAALLLGGQAVAIAAALLVPSALGAAVDAATGGGATGAIVWLGALLAAGAAGSALAVVTGQAGTARTAAWLRRRFSLHVLDAGPDAQRQFPAGDLTSRAVGGAGDAAAVVPSAIMVVTNAATATGGIVALWLLDWRIGLAFCVCVPLTYRLLRSLVRGSGTAYADYQKAQSAIAARLTDAVAGARSIQAAGTVDRETDRILAPLPALAAAGRATWRYQRGVVWRAGLLAPLAELLVLAMAGVGVSTGDLTPGQFLAAAAYAQLALGLLDIFDALLGIQHARAAAARVADVLRLPAPARGTRRPATRPRGRIRLRDVHVRVSDRTVLSGIDLDLPAGAVVALVGATAAGKTTLAGLLGRLTDPDAGDVLLDGQPVRELSPASLHSAVAYAFAEPSPLGRTVADDIAYGLPHPDPGRVERAAVAAGADEFIQRLPLRYDTPMDALRLSGGQRQRLGLARAIARDPAVLVLDDATSSLDTATEARVRAALDRDLPGRTRIIVARTARSAARADVVVWLDQGRVRGTGPHADLWHHAEYRAVFRPNGSLHHV